MSFYKPNEEQTRLHLTEHYQAYPKLQAQDIFKYLFHSTLGCEHLVSDERSALRYLQAEYDAALSDATNAVEPLDGDYSRVHLGVLRQGLHPQTLARMFYKSARTEPCGREKLAEKLAVAQKMVATGELPLDPEDFAAELDAWRAQGFPAVHHSDAFRKAYRPAYRVTDNHYADFLQLFIEIDRILAHRGCAIVAIEGGSASGKSTLSSFIETVYGCNVFHTDDFFLRPEQRTPARLAEVGGNLDRERFAQELLHPLRTHAEPICFRPFDCATQTLEQPIQAMPTPLTIVEGTYSLHPDFGKYYDLAVFLDIDPSLQNSRILQRNSPQLAKRFFDEWIPLENTYFSLMDIKSRANLIFPIFR